MSVFSSRRDFLVKSVSAAATLAVGMHAEGYILDAVVQLHAQGRAVADP